MEWFNKYLGYDKYKEEAVTPLYDFSPGNNRELDKYFLPLYQQQVITHPDLDYYDYTSHIHKYLSASELNIIRREAWVDFTSLVSSSHSFGLVLACYSRSCEGGLVGARILANATWFDLIEPLDYSLVRYDGWGRKEETLPVGWGSVSFIDGRLVLVRETYHGFRFPLYDFSNQVGFSSVDRVDYYLIKKKYLVPLIQDLEGVFSLSFDSSLKNLYQYTKPLSSVLAPLLGEWNTGMAYVG